MNKRLPIHRFLVVGNPENRRVHLFAAAAARQGCRVEVIPWVDLLNTSNPADLVASAMDLATAIRLESPGENFEVERLLIQRGAVPANVEDCSVSSARGRIQHGRLWFLGFRSVLQTLAQLDASTRWFNHPNDIVTLFDKPLCVQRLAECGVRVPEQFGLISGYEQLRQVLMQQGCSRVFLKPCYGSSASGVVALQWSPARVFARTSVEIVQQDGELQLFNSLRVRSYTCENDLAFIVDTLARDGLYAERWVPKAGHDERMVDLRIVVINGRRMHSVLRSSRHPMTNLHLGNQRGDLDAFLRRIPAELNDEITNACQLSATVAGRSLYTGIDLLVESGFRKYAVMELNAFGDLLPNLTLDGWDTYEAEIVALRESAARMD